MSTSPTLLKPCLISRLLSSLATLPTSSPSSSSPSPTRPAPLFSQQDLSDPEAYIIQALSFPFASSSSSPLAASLEEIDEDGRDWSCVGASGGRGRRRGVHFSPSPDGEPKEGETILTVHMTYSPSEYDRTPLDPPTEEERACRLPSRGSRCLRLLSECTPAEDDGRDACEPDRREINLTDDCDDVLYGITSPNVRENRWDRFVSLQLGSRADEDEDDELSDPEPECKPAEEDEDEDAWEAWLDARTKSPCRTSSYPIADPPTPSSTPIPSSGMRRGMFESTEGSGYGGDVDMEVTPTGRRSWMSLSLMPLSLSLSPPEEGESLVLARGMTGGEDESASDTPSLGSTSGSSSSSSSLTPEMTPEIFHPAPNHLAPHVLISSPTSSSNSYPSLFTSEPETYDSDIGRGRERDLNSWLPYFSRSGSVEREASSSPVPGAGRKAGKRKAGPGARPGMGGRRDVFGCVEDEGCLGGF